jgi:hypothetical protein
MYFETETVCATGVACKEALAVLPNMLIGNATPNLKERRE